MIKYRAISLALVFFFFGASSHHAAGQTVIEQLWRSVKGMVVPEYVSSTYKLRAFIASQQPIDSSRKAHLQRLNRIWDYAVYISDGDIETALFISTVATIPYYTFPAYVPLIGLKITIPVSTESEEAFKQRFLRLPSMLYQESPESGDRDKLPHFFGAAYIQFHGGAPLLSAFAGEFVEIAEKLFKLEGAYDIRDINVNYRGIEFAVALRKGRNVLPSEFFYRSSPGDDNEHRQQ